MTAIPTAAELRQVTATKAREYIREAAAEAIGYLAVLTGSHPYAELRILRKAEEALEDIQNNLDFLNEEFDYAPSDREVGRRSTVDESELLPTCPKCGAEDAMEHHSHRWSSDRGPNIPDADWDECAVCGYATDPE